MERDVTVLRLGHRPQRDQRITTHVGLVARAFGASRFILTVKDDHVLESLVDVRDRFGGEFQVEVDSSPLRIIRNFSGSSVHLTMYGEQLETKVADLRASSEPLLLVVGAGKVGREVYSAVDHNVAVGHQPHSEVAAVALTLDRLRAGNWPEFHGAVQILDDPRGKSVQVRSDPEDDMGEPESGA